MATIKEKNTTGTLIFRGKMAAVEGKD